MGIEEQKNGAREELLAELGRMAATIEHQSATIEYLQEQWDRSKRALLVMEESNVDRDRLAAIHKRAVDSFSSAYESERQALLRITKGFMDLVTDWVVLTENDGRDLMAEFSG